MINNIISTSSEAYKKKNDKSATATTISKRSLPFPSSSMARHLTKNNNTNTNTQSLQPSSSSSAAAAKPPATTTTAAEALTNRTDKEGETSNPSLSQIQDELPQSKEPPNERFTDSRLSNRSRRPYYTPQNPRQFSSSAAKRESVMALGSITHLQHYFVKHGLASREKPTNHKNMVLAIPGREMPLTEEEAEMFDELPEPTPPRPMPSKPNFPTGRALPSLTDLRSTTRDVMGLLDQVCDVWGLVELSSIDKPLSEDSSFSTNNNENGRNSNDPVGGALASSTSSCSSSASSPPKSLNLGNSSNKINQRPQSFSDHYEAQPNNLLQVVGGAGGGGGGGGGKNQDFVVNLLTITTQAVRSVQKFILTLPDPNIFSNSANMGGDLHRRMSQLELSTAARPGVSRSLIGPSRSSSPAPNSLPKPSSSSADTRSSTLTADRSKLSARQSFDPFALFKKRSTTLLESPSSSSSSSCHLSVKEDPLVVLRRVSLEVLGCLKEIEIRFRIPGSATPTANDELFKIPRPTSPATTDNSSSNGGGIIVTDTSNKRSSLSSSTENDDSHSSHSNSTGLVLPSMSWEYRNDVGLKDVRSEALIIKQWLECVDGILEGISIINGDRIRQRRSRHKRRLIMNGSSSDLKNQVPRNDQLMLNSTDNSSQQQRDGSSKKSLITSEYNGLGRGFPKKRSSSNMINQFKKQLRTKSSHQSLKSKNSHQSLQTIKNSSSTTNNGNDSTGVTDGKNRRVPEISLEEVRRSTENLRNRVLSDNEEVFSDQGDFNYDEEEEEDYYEDEEEDYEEFDENDLPDWARDDRFLIEGCSESSEGSDSEMVGSEGKKKVREKSLRRRKNDQDVKRLFACLVHHLPSDALNHLCSPFGEDGSRLKFWDSLSDGTLLCLAYNVGLRQSKRPWGFIPVESIHDMISIRSPTLKNSEGMVNDQKKQVVVGLTFRRMENLKFWAAALKLRYLIKSEVKPTKVRSNSKSDRLTVREDSKKDLMKKKTSINDLKRMITKPRNNHNNNSNLESEELFRESSSSSGGGGGIQNFSRYNEKVIRFDPKLVARKSIGSKVKSDCDSNEKEEVNHEISHNEEKEGKGGGGGGGGEEEEEERKFEWVEMLEELCLAWLEALKSEKREEILGRP